MQRRVRVSITIVIQSIEMAERVGLPPAFLVSREPGVNMT